MFTLNKFHHCCASCAHGEDRRLNGVREIHCPLQADALKANLLKLAIVDPLERCAEYECDEGRFYDLHGFSPAEERLDASAPRPGLDYPGSLSPAI